MNYNLSSRQCELARIMTKSKASLAELLNVAINNISRPNAVRDLYDHVTAHLNL